MKGANRTGRPFSGDDAGDLLYKTLLDFGFAHGTIKTRADNDLTLIDCMITNAVACVPPDNKPTQGEIEACRTYLAARIAALPNLSAIVALGHVAHRSTIAALDLKQKDFPFAHAAARTAPNGVRIFDSYHCSRYNMNTGVMTPEMFRAVFANVRSFLS